eukprot:scaffold3192_cov83-Skeletonema_marinoi.AAC.2
MGLIRPPSFPLSLYYSIALPKLCGDYYSTTTDDDNPSSSSTKGVAVRKDPPLFTDHPAPDAKRPCLDNAPNDDIDDDDIDDDEWTSCSMSDRSSSTDSELTELIKNGIKENGGDEYVDEVADHHGVIITFEDASTSIARLEIDITKTITLRRPNKRNVRNVSTKIFFRRRRQMCPSCPIFRLPSQRVASSIISLLHPTK